MNKYVLSFYNENGKKVEFEKYYEHDISAKLAASLWLESGYKLISIIKHVEIPFD
jgi:hypothetical protein